MLDPMGSGFSMITGNAINDTINNFDPGGILAAVSLVFLAALSLIFIKFKYIKKND